VRLPLSNEEDVHRADHPQHAGNLGLGTPTGSLLDTPSTSILTIADNDAGGTVAFAAASFSVAEDGGSATITQVRTGGAPEVATALTDPWPVLWAQGSRPLVP
jgi:hypothetical protein